MTILNKDKILETAKDFVSQGKFDKAIKEYEKLLSADPKDMRVKLQIAELFAKRRQIPEAIQVYREVAENYAQDGFFLKAVTVYKNILRLNPSLLEVNQGLAALYEKMGLAQDAILQYQILASALEQKRDFAQGLKLYERLAELAPQNEGFRVKLAEAYEREGRQEEAIQQYETLAKQFREQKKDSKKLIELYERILPHRPANKEMLTELIQLQYEKKDYASALKWLEKNKQVVSEEATLLIKQAEMYALLNQLETARGKYQELAELYLDRGENEKALKAYEEILVLLPEESGTIQNFVKDINPDAFAAMAKRAEEKRKRVAEDQRLKEEAVEKAKEAKEREREAEKEAKRRGRKKVVQTVEDKSVEEKKEMVAPTVNPQETKAPMTAPMGAEEIQKHLQIAKTSLSLIQAYRNTGLEEEAKEEAKHAKASLKKILGSEPSHPEAKELMAELKKNG